MAQVTLRNIRKNYGPGGKGGKGGAGGGASPNDDIIKGVDLEVRDGEFLVFVGPSGCGKSTMLRMIAGLEEITSGELRIDGVLANDLRPADRGAAMVFQSYALYPHMTVAENMGFSLKMAGVPKAERSTMVGRAAEVLGIGHMLARYPKELSGGERQRVAIGRAIVRKPKVFLFDEPLSNLDAALRVNMRIELSRLHKELGATMIYVTHDQVEAMTMGDRIAVFNKGKIEQLGAPMELYTRPANEFVATFLGAPCINLVERPADGAAASAHQALWRALGGEQQAGARRLGLRPEHLHLAGAADSAGQADATDKAGLVPATVELAEHLGDISILHLRVEGVAELLHAKVGADHAHCAAGQTVMLRPEPGRALAFGADGKRI